MSLSIPDAVVKAITEITSKYQININHLKRNDVMVQWKSNCGNLGNVRFRIPLSLFETEIQKGVQKTAMLVSFATLLNQPVNAEFAERVKQSSLYGAHDLFTVDTSTDDKINVNVYLPQVWSYRKIPIRCSVNDLTGDFIWFLEDDTQAFIQAIPIFMEDHLHTDEDAETDLDVVDRQMTVYKSIGLHQMTTPSIPIMETTQSIRQYSRTRVVEESASSLPRTPVKPQTDSPFIRPMTPVPPDEFDEEIPNGSHNSPPSFKHYNFETA